MPEQWKRIRGFERIREAVAGGAPRQVMADFYGIHVMTIGEIVRGEIWR